MAAVNSPRFAKSIMFQKSAQKITVNMKLSEETPKKCIFFSIYLRCKFGKYCAFKHSENNQKKEIEDLKDKVKRLEDKDIDNPRKCWNLMIGLRRFMQMSSRL